MLLYKIVIDPFRQRLNSAMRRVAQGNFTERVLIEGTGEFKPVGTIFQHLWLHSWKSAPSLRRVFYKVILLQTQVTERTKALQAA